MKTTKKIFRIIGIVVLLLMVIFLAGRFGWKLLGFRTCQSAGIEAVEVRGDSVRIVGFYPGSFPEGFCGYYAREYDGKLYVGFRFSAVFGRFETGNFDVTIPVKGKIDEVILKTKTVETRIWTAANDFLPQSEQYGVFVRLERADVASVSMSYEGFDGGRLSADGGTWEMGKYYFMDNDIMMAAKDAESLVPFTVTVRDEAETVIAVGDFSFDAATGKMYLTIAADGRIEENMTACGAK